MMKAIITGSTGMVGRGVLLECLDDPSVEKVLVLNRTSLGVSHPKLEEVIHKDFTDFTAIKDQLTGYDACFHCMGVSSAGISEETYHTLTYEISHALATTLHSVNSEMVFTYVSGAGTDSTEKSNTMWARVKGKTENMIFSLGFKDAYAFRPGAILPERGVKSKTKLYNTLYVIMRPVFPLMKKMKSVTTTINIARAMIQLCHQPQELKILEGADINRLVS